MNTLIHSKTKLSNSFLIYPKIDLVLNAINENNYFTFSKISVNWWEIYRCAMKRKNLKESNIINNINIISEEMVYVWDHMYDGKKSEWKVSKDIFISVLSRMLKPLPKNLFLGFTDRSPGAAFFSNKKKCKYPDHYTPRHKFVLETIDELVPANTLIYDTMCWKFWGMYGEFKKIIDISNDKKIPIVLVGPEHLKDFGKKCNINNFDYIKIDKNEASLHVDEYEEKILEKDAEIKEKKIYIMQGGGAITHLSFKLHNKLYKSFNLDVGKGLDFYVHKYGK